MKTLEVAQLSLFKNITDDRIFVNKFIFILSMIMGLSAYITIVALNEVDDISLRAATDKLPIVSLEKIEREINGNLVSLEIVEDDFSELEFIEISSAKENLHPVIENKPKVNEVKKETEVSKIKKIFISSQKSSSNSNTISFIKKKFYATNSADLSIQIANKFFDEANYKKALKWSLITNEIDSKSEESWVMFAKVKQKMGKSSDAIAALSQYLKLNSSNKIENLLVSMKK